MRRWAPLAVAGGLALAACSGGGGGAAPATSTVPTTSVATTSATSTTTSTTSTTSTSSTTSTTTSTTTTTIAPAPLPTPVPPPPDDASTDPTLQVGTIEIPRLGLTAPMWEGVRLTTLNRGPGHWPGTAMPGEAGNVVVAGHRVSHHAEFRHVERLVAGDDVVMTTGSGRFDYKVVSTEVVKPDALWIVDQTPDATATLFACHPPGSVRERIVVHLRLSA